MSLMTFDLWTSSLTSTEKSECVLLHLCVLKIDFFNFVGSNPWIPVLRHIISLSYFDYVFFFRRVERSFFLEEYVKIIPFFPVPDIPLRFTSVNLIFSTRMGRIYLIFEKHTTMGSKSIIYQIWAPDVFFGERLSKKSHFLNFSEGKVDVFESYLYGKLGNTIFWTNHWKSFPLSGPLWHFLSTFFRAKENGNLWFFEISVLFGFLK